MQPIQVPEQQLLQPKPIPEGRVIAKYGVPYPIIDKPDIPMPILKYGVPYPHDDIIGPGRFNVPHTKYGINMPR